MMMNHNYGSFFLGEFHTYSMSVFIYIIWGAYMDLNREKKRINYCTFGCLGVGAIIGCILFLAGVLWSDYPILEYGLEDFQVLSMLNISKKTFIIYICQRRLLQWGSLLAVWCITSYYLAACGYNLIIGGYYGFLVADLFIKFGVGGIVYGMACFMPHYIFAFGAVYCMGIWFGNENKMRTGYYYNRVNKMQYFIKIFAILFLIFASLVTEINFQKNILNYFYQYLV